MTAARESLVPALLHRAETEPIGIDISDYSDDFCAGFLAGQRSVLEPPEPDSQENTDGDT